MGLWRKIFILSFREKSVYRFDYLAGTLFSFLYIILKIYIWKGVYAGSGGAVRGVLLSDMVAYSVLAGFTGGITKTSVMGEFNDSVCSGTISSELLLPVGLKKYLFTRSLARNMFQTVYGILPSVLMAMLLFGIHVRIRYPNLILYLLAAAMGKYMQEDRRPGKRGCPVRWQHGRIPADLRERRGHGHGRHGAGHL